MSPLTKLTAVLLLTFTGLAGATPVAPAADSAGVYCPNPGTYACDVVYADIVRIVLSTSLLTFGLILILI